MPKRRLSNLFSHCVRQRSLRVAVVALLVVTSSLQAQSGASSTQTRATSDRTELHQALLDLTNVWTVMCVAAHPDDEDGATLTVLRRKYGVHTVSLFSTFGEGGQNAVGPELYEELGAIRAQETLRAAEIQGSEPYFLGLKDFGFSKSAEEASRIWGHDEALGRMVFQIRKLRPDVIITNHDTTSGHGHHQATGRLVLEAFDAAADPKRFPEQLKTETVWQVQRLFVRMPTDRGAKTPAPDRDASEGETVTIDRNEHDPERGTTYAEQALHALQQHATQGPWPQSLPKDGLPPIRYRLVREANGSAPLTTSPKTFFDGLQLPGEVDSSIRLEALDMNVFTPFLDRPDELFKMIAMSRESLGSSQSTDKLDSVRARLIDNRSSAALAALSGITATSRSVETTFVPNSQGHMVIDIANAGTREATIQSISIDGVKAAKDLQLPKTLAQGSIESLNTTVWIAKDEPWSLPHSAHLYDGRVFGKELKGVVRIEVGGRVFSVPVSTRVDIAPAVEIASISPSPLVTTLANAKRPLTFTVRLVNHQNTPFKGNLIVATRITRNKGKGENITLAPNEARDFKISNSDISAPELPGQASIDGVVVSLRALDNSGSSVLESVFYVDALVTSGLRVGYVRSFDDTLRNALASLGVESQELSMNEIRSDDLQKFNTIIIDNRGYQAHPELVELNSRLLDFAKNGGTLIVFYQKSNEWNEDTAKNRPSLVPFPIVLGDERVTDETAPVTFIDPDHLLLNSPNKITAKDFAGWIQERGLYYPKTWDPRYSAPLAMSDGGEDPLRGGLLVADYGRGHYIYTSMVWYRQLRAGVPGGYRMFANMISYAKR